MSRSTKIRKKAKFKKSTHKMQKYVNKDMNTTNSINNYHTCCLLCFDGEFVNQICRISENSSYDTLALTVCREAGGIFANIFRSSMCLSIRRWYSLSLGHLADSVRVTFIGVFTISQHSADTWGQSLMKWPFWKHR